MSGRKLETMTLREWEDCEARSVIADRDRLHAAITAALGEIKRSRGTPRLALIGVERILAGAIEVKK